MEIRERLRDVIENAHMAGQNDAGVDAGYSNARAYCNGVIDKILALMPQWISCEQCNAFDQIKEEGLHGTEIIFDDICTLIPSNDNCDIDRDGPNEIARNCPLSA